MKIRTPEGECLICHDNGEVIIRAVGATTLQAIKRMRQFVEAKIAEDAQRATTTTQELAP